MGLFTIFTIDPFSHGLVIEKSYEWHQQSPASVHYDFPFPAMLIASRIQLAFRFLSVPPVVCIAAIFATSITCNKLRSSGGQQEYCESRLDHPGKKRFMPVRIRFFRQRQFRDHGRG